MKESHYVQKHFDISLSYRVLTKSTDGVNTGEQRKTASYGRTPSLFLHSHYSLQLALFLKNE